MGKLSNWKHLKAEMQSRAVMTNWRGNGVAESSNPPPFLIVYNVYEYDLFALPHRQIANKLYAVLLTVKITIYENTRFYITKKFKG